MEKKVVAINNNGEIVKSFNTNFEKGFFTADDQFVGVSNKSVFSIIPSQLKLNFEIKADKNSIFIDVTAKNNSVVIAKAKNPKLKNGEWYYKNPIILKLNFAGKVISEVKTETELFSKYKFEKTNNNLEFMAGDKSTTVK